MFDDHQLAIISQEIAIAIERGIENAVATIVNSKEFKESLPTPAERRRTLLANMAASMIAHSNDPSWCVAKAEKILSEIELREANPNLPIQL